MVFGRKKPSSPASAPSADYQPSTAPDALLDAIRYVGMVSPPGTYVQTIASPMPCAGQSGAGFRFAIETNNGPGFAFFFRTFASVWIDGESAPRPEIPTEMIERQIPAYASALKQMLG